MRGERKVPTEWPSWQRMERNETWLAETHKLQQAKENAVAKKKHLSDIEFLNQNERGK